MNQTAFVNFLIGAGFALFALGGYAVWFMMVSSTREDATKAAVEVLRIEKEDAAIADAEETIAALSSDEATLRSYFVAKNDTVPFLEKLESIGVEFGSVVEVLSVTEPVEGAGRLTLALRIEGNFASVMRTLGVIEYGPQDIRVESVTLDTASSEESEGAVWVAAAMISVASIEELP